MGKSIEKFYCSGYASGHPHVGGEIVRTRQTADAPGGPSPRGWGNPPMSLSSGQSPRAIPTWVGKSWLWERTETPQAGHPHVGGEIHHIVVMMPLRGGPSPRGWGNLGLRLLLPGLPRAIPTWVGKSSVETKGQQGPAGHPHVGGEIVAAPLWCNPPRGPSPRGWGNLRCPRAG